MSKPNAKAQKPEAAQSADQAQDAATPGPGTPDPAMVQPPPPGPAQDEHHGQGGMYTVINSRRVLVGRTATATQDNTAAASPDTPTE